MCLYLSYIQFFVPSRFDSRPFSEASGCDTVIIARADRRDMAINGKMSAWVIWSGSSEKLDTLGGGAGASNQLLMTNQVG